MNRKELIKDVVGRLKEKQYRKPVFLPKQSFSISDDEGNSKTFSVRKTEKAVLLTLDDVEAVIEAVVDSIEASLKRGESVSVHGFGTLGLKYRKGRTAKIPNTEEWCDVAGRYVPKFHPGAELKMCAKIYELSLNEKGLNDPLPVFDDKEETESD